MLGVVPLLVAAVVAVAFYGLAYWIRGFRFPIGFDTYFYVGAIRAAGRFGLADSHIAARPAYPLVAAALGSVLETRPWSTAVVLPFAMAAGMGLAGAALAARWGLSGWKLGMFTTLVAVCGVVGRLVAGRSENLMTVWLLTAALAVSVWGRTRAIWAAVAFLILGAGLTESPFLTAFLAIVGATVVAQPVVAWARRRFAGAATGRLAGAAAAAAVITALALFLWNGTVPGNAIQRLPPTSLFRSRLFTELRIAGAIPGVLFVVAVWWAARRTAPPSAEPVRRLLAMWLVVTALVVVVGTTGVPAPTYRAITFGVPITLALGAAPLAPFLIGTGGTERKRRILRRMGAVAIAIFVLYPASVLWFRDQRSPASREQAGQIAAAGHYLRSLPPRANVVIAMDDQPAIRAYFNQRLVEAVVPTSRRTRLVVLPGRAEDAAAEVPTERRDPLSREVIEELFPEVEPLLEAGAPVLALRDFDLTAYLTAVTRGAPIVGNDVAVVRGPSPDPNLEGSVPGAFAPLPRGPALLLQGLVALALLGLAGAGWVRLALPSAPAAVWLGLAPAFGATLLTVLSLTAVHAGLELAGSGGPLVVALAVGSSLGILLQRRTLSPRPSRV